MCVCVCVCNEETLAVSLMALSDAIAVRSFARNSIEGCFGVTDTGEIVLAVAIGERRVHGITKQ